MIVLRKFVLSIIVILFLVLALAGCNLPMMANEGSTGDDLAEIQVAQTMVAIQILEKSATAQADQPIDAGEMQPINALTATMTLTPSITSTATITMTPTITLTSTLDTPMVSVSHVTYCRTGPGTMYDLVGTLMEGEEAKIVARSEDGQYWVIKNPDAASECWLWGYYATAVGPTNSLPIYMPPPTPTPAFDWSGSWTSSVVLVGDPPGPGVIMSVNVNGKDLTASMDIGCGNVFSLVGTISDDYLSVSGTWTDVHLSSGNFELFAVGTNQFNGNRDFGVDMSAWCGWRGGAGAPSTCYRE